MKRKAIGGKREEPVSRSCQGVRKRRRFRWISTRYPARPVIELTGKTEAGSAGDGQRARGSGHRSDGSFHYFMPPMPTGESMITITAQNSKGGVNTQQRRL